MSERIPFRKDTFAETPEGLVLLANRCRSCGQVFFPKAVFCLSCLGEDMEEVKLSQRGKLYSYTVGHMPSMHFQPPYAIGYVDLPEGVKVFAPLQLSENAPLEVGMEMEVFLDKLWDQEEQEVVGYRFRPAR